MRLYSNRFHGCRVEEYTWRGHRLLVIENELLRVGVVASKGADIIEFRYKPRDLDVLWHAPQPLLRPGEYVPTVCRRDGSFLDYYPGGWQEVLPNGGPGCTYKGAELGQHGEVALLPWDVRVREDTSKRIEVEFMVETFRTPFRLSRRMVLEGGSPVLRLEESVTTLGEEDVALAWGHHPAFGPPFLEAGCVIEMPRCQVAVPEYARDLNHRRFKVGGRSQFPYVETEAGELARVDLVPGKETRSEDVVVFSELEETWCALRNPHLKLAVGLVWDGRTFPFLWCWQVYGGAWGYPYYGRTFNTALEPFTCPIIPLTQAAEQRQTPILAPGQGLTAVLEAGIFETDCGIGRLGFGGRVEPGGGPPG